MINKVRITPDDLMRLMPVDKYLTFIENLRIRFGILKTDPIWITAECLKENVYSAVEKIQMECDELNSKDLKLIADYCLKIRENKI